MLRTVLTYPSNASESESDTPFHIDLVRAGQLSRCLVKEGLKRIAVMNSIRCGVVTEQQHFSDL